MTYAPIQGKCPVCHQDSANTSFKAGAASRDAEIAELVEALEHSVLYVPDLATVPGIAAALTKVRKP